jgi:hypothetical protein
MIGFIGALIFVLCWILGMITWVRIVILNRQLKTELAQKAPSLNRSPGFDINSYSISQITISGLHLFRMFISFGTTQKTRSFVNNFFDLEAIGKLTDTQLNRRIDTLIKLFSLYARTWLLGILSILVGFLFWPSNL